MAENFLNLLGNINLNTHEAQHTLSGKTQRDPQRLITVKMLKRRENLESKKTRIHPLEGYGVRYLKCPKGRNNSQQSPTSSKAIFHPKDFPK